MGNGFLGLFPKSGRAFWVSTSSVGTATITKYAPPKTAPLTRKDRVKSLLETLAWTVFFVGTPVLAIVIESDQRIVGLMKFLILPSGVIIALGMWVLEISYIRRNLKIVC